MRKRKKTVMPKTKKAVKKTVKKVVKPKIKKEKPIRQAQGKPIGKVTHYYGGIEVAIVKFNKLIKAGTEIKFKGATTDFSQKVKSMQYDHKDITSAKKGQEVGIKVEEKVREDDEIFEAK